MVSMELRDRLQAMRRQETHYKCCDCTRPPRALGDRKRCTAALAFPSGSSLDLVHLWLDECAALVTDPAISVASRVSKDCSLSSDAAVASPTKRIERESVHPPRSPSSVTNFPNLQSNENDSNQDSAASGANEVNAPGAMDMNVYLNNPELGSWRLQMFDWACVVVDGFQMDRCEVLATAFNLLDRFTTLELKRPNSPPVTREDFRLFAMTCLYIAVKLVEPFPRKICLDALSIMSRDFYSPQVIAQTEVEILEALQWRTTPPSSVAFCRELAPFLFPNGYYNNSCLNNNYIFTMADLEQVYSNICDVTVSDPSFLDYSPSIIAVAALLHAARLTCSASHHERLVLSHQAMGILGLEQHDGHNSCYDKEHADLDAVYQKMELFYC